MPSLMNRIKSLFNRKANKRRSTAKANTPQQNGASNQQSVLQNGQQQPVQAQSNAQQQTVQTQDRATAATLATNAASTGQLPVQLQNQTSSSTVYAYISKCWLLSSDLLPLTLQQLGKPSTTTTPSS